MNIININDKNYLNVPNDNKHAITNKLEINLLDTINDKDIFEGIKNIQNIKINDKNKKKISMMRLIT